MDNKVYFFDTTLRDGEQSPGATMNLQEKLRLAHQLEVLGVDIMEAGFPASSPGDFESVRSIAQQAGDIQVAGLARCVDNDIDRCWEAVKVARRPRIHTFLSTSPLHMKHKLRKEPEVVLQMIEAGVRRCAGYTDNVEFSAEDASRSDKDFLCRVVETAIKAGATTINLPDTVGYAQPDEFAALIKYVIENTPNSDKAIFSVHCHNDLGLAVANTLAALRVGARQAEVTIGGIGERAGNAALEEVVMALRVRHDLYHLEHNIRTEQLYPSCRLLSMTIGQPIANNKAIVGRNAFAHESGIHVHGVMANSLTYEPFKPEMVGVERHIVIGKHSGEHSVRGRLEALNVRFPEEHMPELMAAIKEIAVGGKEIDDAELVAIADNVLWKKETKIQTAVLEGIAVITGKSVTSTATVTILINGDKRVKSEIGVGPVDAALNAIREAVNDNITLEEYKLAAVTGGSDSICEATLMVKNVQDDGNLSVGKAVGLDVVQTSVDAMMAAINRDFARQRSE